MITPERRAEWREEATRYARGEAMTCDHRILALLDALDATEGERDRNWRRREAMAETLHTAVAPRAEAAESRARDLEAENARLRALLAETLALLEELDAAWGGTCS
jgi:hypothetical protein